MLDALTLDQVRVFVAVAEEGSFRKGAARLSRVQSAISHAMANLEQELGISLFDRSGHRPVLTHEGKTLLSDARAILLKVDSLKARARGMGDGVEMSLSVNVDMLYPLPCVAAALNDLRDAFPTVQIRLETSALGGPINALLDRRAQLGIMVGEGFRDPHIETDALGYIRSVAVAAPSHPLAECQAAPVLSAEMLTDHLQIVLEDPTDRTAGHDIGVLSPGTWRVTGQDVKHALILGGAGWGRLPYWSIADDLAHGRLVRLPATQLGPGGELQMAAYLAHRRDAPLGPAARKLRATLLLGAAPVA